MEDSKIEIPFAAIVVDKIADAVEKAMCSNIDQHDFISVEGVVRDGRLSDGYFMEDGSKLHLDDDFTIQTFAIPSVDFDLVDPRLPNVCNGINVVMPIDFVIVGYSGCDRLALWRALSVFAPDKIFHGCGTNQAGEKVQVSGKLVGKPKVSTSASQLAKKYMPTQLEKINRHSETISVLWLKMQIRFDNICDLCLRPC